MTKDELIESGFINAFISEYLEYYIYSYYPDKDRLLYVLCDNDNERDNITRAEITNLKSKIKELGYEDLSFGFIQSAKTDSYCFIENFDKRKEFWVKRFAEVFEQNIGCLTVVSDFIDDFQNNCKIKDFDLLAQEFWSVYKKFKPKCEVLVDVIQKEDDLFTLIDNDIDNFKENNNWEFDFEEYREFLVFSKPIELLFDFCDLLVALFRLVNFQTLFEKPLGFNELSAAINNAFLRLEGFLNGNIIEYHRFGFNEAFTKLFIEAKKTENYTFENCKLITDYWNLTAQLCYDLDKSEFLNQNALKNNDCNNDLNEIGKLNWERIEEFTYFTTPDEIEEYEHKFSISDVIKNKSTKTQSPVSHQHFVSNTFNATKTTVKPIFKPESIETIFQYLKDFFFLEQQAFFKYLLETGTDCNEKLVFLDNGNRLADSFRLLIKNDIITGCTQKELENWVFNNFSYKYRGEVKSFSLRYLNDIISTDKEKCRKPILNIKNGIVIKA